MRRGQVVERIEFFNESPVSVQEHQIQRIAPVIRERLRESIAVCGELLGLIDEDPGADEGLVESVNHSGIGEQTCSQQSAAWSTTLIVKRPPQHDGKHHAAK